MFAIGSICELRREGTSATTESLRVGFGGKDGLVDDVRRLGALPGAAEMVAGVTTGETSEAATGTVEEASSSLSEQLAM